MKKRFASLILAAMMAVSFGAVTASAEDTSMDSENIVTSYEATNEYIIFASPDEDDRIDSRGFFTFDVTNSLDSDSFRVESTSTNISLMTDANYGGYVTVEIRDTRYSPDDASTWKYYNKSYRFKADGQAHVQTYTGLSTSNYYYLHISAGGSRKSGTGLIVAYAG